MYVRKGVSIVSLFISEIGDKTSRGRFMLNLIYSKAFGATKTYICRAEADVDQPTLRE